MHHTEHAITIDAPLDAVYEILADVEGYARLFPPTQSVEILEEGLQGLQALEPEGLIVLEPRDQRTQAAGIGGVVGEAAVLAHAREAARLERREVLRDRRLGEVERLRRAGQRAVVGDRAQRAQAADVVHKLRLSKSK